MSPLSPQIRHPSNTPPLPTPSGGGWGGGVGLTQGWAKIVKRFESFMDLIRYFNSLGIKLDRKTLNVRLKDGKEYKGYFFSYE